MREKKAKNHCPCLAQHERKRVQSGQSTNVHVIPGYYALNSRTIQVCFNLDFQFKNVFF